MTPDLRNLRSRLGASSDDLDRLSDVPPLGSARMVGRVFAKVTIPTTNAVYYAVHPVDVGGIESEGSSGVLLADTTRTCYFLVLGTKAPAVGDDLIARSIGGRWVAWRGGASSGTALVGTVPGCTCLHTSPVTIFMTVTGSFALSNHPPRNDTFTYTLNALGSGQNFWVGSGVFPGGPAGDYVQYIRCDASQTGNFYLSSQNVPGTFVVPNEWHWQVGFSGNTCSPIWQMTNSAGNAGFPGSGQDIQLHA